MGLIGPGESCLATTTRNFKGRLGSPDSEVMLCGPYGAASASPV
jgi:3-isopropylmalate/(R)-2-methylmalate dehydratase large subunit